MGRGQAPTSRHTPAPHGAYTGPVVSWREQRPPDGGAENAGSPSGGPGHSWWLSRSGNVMLINSGVPTGNLFSLCKSLASGWSGHLCVAPRGVWGSRPQWELARGECGWGVGVEKRWFLGSFDRLGSSRGAAVFMERLTERSACVREARTQNTEMGQAWRGAAMRSVLTTAIMGQAVLMVATGTQGGERWLEAVSQPRRERGCLPLRGLSAG